MKDLKNLVVAGLTLAGVATSSAQQVVKRITNNATSTIVELFVLRNGTSLPNTTGNFNFNTGTSDNTGTVIAYSPVFANTYNNNNFPTGQNPKTTEQIGNGTFPFNGNQTNKTNNTNFVANGGSGATLNMTIPQEDGNADSTQDANTLSDMMYSKFTLPKTLNDGSAIPNGLIVKCISRAGIDQNTGGPISPRQQVISQREQAALSWLPITTDRLGFTPPTLEEIGADGQLGIDDFVTTPAADLKMYPNPAHESITLDNNNDIPYETLDVEIYDATGREVIGRGAYTEGQLLDISMLADGQYFDKSTSDDKKTTTKQLIKN